MAPGSLVEVIDARDGGHPEIDAKARAISATHVDAVARAHSAGVRIAMGSDSGVFAHGASWKELGWLVQAGLTSAHALGAAHRTVTAPSE
jgi:imidazolonepropionase-like amidohydrolase